MGWQWLRVAGGLPAAHLFALGLWMLKAESLVGLCQQLPQDPAGAADGGPGGGRAPVPELWEGSGPCWG